MGRPIASRDALYMAAVLAAGPGAFLTDRSAADLWGFRRYEGPIEVVRSESRKPSRFWLERPGVLKAKAVKVRRSRHLAGIDVSEELGIPVIGPERTLLNLAGVLTGEDFETSFKEADRRLNLSQEKLNEYATRNLGWRGAKRFRRMVLRRHPESQNARSLLEVLFLEICRDFSLGDPSVNMPEGRFIPDFRWPDIKLIVEVDGFEHHRGRMAFLEDAHRENELRAAGYQVIRFTWEEVNERPDRVASLVRQEQERLRSQNP